MPHIQSLAQPASFEHDQRKNNLCRRIRIEKQKKGKEAGDGKKTPKGRSASKYGGGGRVDAVLDVEYTHSGAPDQLAPQPQAVPSGNDASLIGQGPDVQRSDSFLEEIMDLPEIDNFDVGGDVHDDDLGFLQD